MDTTTLIPRNEFRALIFGRDQHACVLCDQPAVDAHHLIERKLWPNGGYYHDNGVSVCEQCHYGAEYTLRSVDELRRGAGITNVMVPPGFDADMTYDKWGNQILESGRRTPGPLFNETGCRRALGRGRVLWLFDSLPG